MSSFFKNLLRYVEADIIRLEECGDIPCVYVDPKSIIRLLTILRDQPSFQMEQLVDIIATDYPKNEKRFEITYHLLSYAHNQRLFIKVETNDMLPTITCIFNNASWYEREVFDLMGVNFKDHPDLRRILTDYHFDGHPLRKDFPLSGYTEVYYNDDLEKVDCRPTCVTERSFDFISPWEGMLKTR